MKLRMLASAFALGAAALLASCSTANQQARRPTQTAAAQPAGPHPGEAVYKQRCATCHDNPEATKAPARETLARMSPGQITNALITGIMIAQAVGAVLRGGLRRLRLSLGRRRVGRQLDRRRCAARPTAARRSSTARRRSRPSASTSRNQRATRSYAQAGLKAGGSHQSRSRLGRRLPGCGDDALARRRSSATRIFLPVGESKNRVFAFDISDNAKPCIQWVYEGDRTLRTSAGYRRAQGRQEGRHGRRHGRLHPHDRRQDRQGDLGAAHAASSPARSPRRTPVLVGDKVIAPSSQYEIMMAAQDGYECCKIHGGVVALDAMTGKRVWEGHTMEQAKPIRDRGDGQMLWGPAGAPVWNSPSIDLKRNRLYVGTGEANSDTGAQEHRRADGVRPQGRLDQVGAPGDRERRLQRRLRPQWRRARTARRTRCSATSTSAPRPSSPRRRTGRTSSSPARSPARSGRWIPTPAPSSGAATSARAARTAASTGASRSTTRTSMRRSPIPAARSPDRTSPPTSSPASTP